MSDEEIKNVTLTYISGRQVDLTVMEARAALNQSDWAAGKPNLVTLHDGISLKIYRDGKSIVFVTPQETKTFDSLDDLKAEPNKYWLTLYGFNVLDKSIYDL